MCVSAHVLTLGGPSNIARSKFTVKTWNSENFNSKIRFNLKKKVDLDFLLK